MKICLITDDRGLGLSYDSDHCEKVGEAKGENPSQESLTSFCSAVSRGGSAQP